MAGSGRRLSHRMAGSEAHTSYRPACHRLRAAEDPPAEHVAAFVVRLPSGERALRR